jgi:two-component system C4-dicarboxylate transport sensor histidine kinase DctB
LQGSIVRAEQLATLGTMSASIGHEIANPAMYAQLHLQFAIDSASVEGVSKAILDDLRTAQKGVEQVTSLLRDLRSLSMDTTPGSDVTEVDPVLQTVIDLVRPALGGAELHLRSVPVPAVCGSRGRLVQVLLNVVRNAIESLGDRRGNIWIDVAHPAPEWVQIDIADDGPGLAGELRERLFEPFITTKLM